MFSTEQMSEAKKVLIVDDNRAIRAAVADRLRKGGYELAEAADGVQGLSVALAEKVDCVILDVVMPGIDGFKLCQLMRSNGVRAPILMLTEKSTIEDKKEGFTSGADDYLPKPFDPVELELRVEALLRRSAPSQSDSDEQNVLNFGELKIDLSRHRVTLQDHDVTLTPIEFDILKMLARRPGVVFSREQILDEIWQTSYEGYKRNIDPHVNRLRAKLEANPRQPQYVQTVWGVGYKFNDSAATK